MPAQQGRAVLLKIGTGTGSPEVFQTVAGLRAKQLQLNTETVDVTHADSVGHWRELLAGGGPRSLALSGNGLFKDETSDELVRAAFFNQAIVNWQAIVPDFGTFEGPFQITSLEYGGTYDGAATFSVTLQSAGAVTFVAA